MSDLFPATGGTYLDQDAYIADFDRRFWRTDAEGFWKLERMQSYDEGDFPSWQALRHGDWDRSLRLIEELRPEYEEHYGKIAAAGFAMHRVRVVDTPLIPYIQWELTILHTKFAYGERVNVLDATEVAGEETEGPLPELCLMGTDAVYVLDYTLANEPNGAVRHTDPATVTRARTLIQRLYAAGEALDTYFPREVAGLPAPRGL
ncbi:hypothetical protein OG194_42005 [Streptomyces sp. NBC_01288]|uniref:DUF6879 family protein n=1 Tax=Streptomyces sp. NBC_01288 TaxID=2903814 RepID=UPI002E13F8E6|nr:DUF6879 family protein [Streptomyces sp. NBC_01288]WSL12217.1 hypothetical protein OG194_42005 [Streptomyces sp. NBC_01288]